MAALSNIRIDIHAEQKRREWRSWARKTLTADATSELSSTEESQTIEKLRILKTESEAARSYEMPSASLSAVCAGVLEFALSVGQCAFIAVVGDHRAPAAFRLRAKDIQLLFGEAMAQDETVVLATESLDGIIAIDVARLSASKVEILLTGTGTLVPAVEFVAKLLPTGRHFDGN